MTIQKQHLSSASLEKVIKPFSSKQVEYANLPKMPHYVSPAQAYFTKRFNQTPKRRHKKQQPKENNILVPPRPRLFGTSEKDNPGSNNATELQTLAVRFRMEENNLRGDSVRFKNDDGRFQQPYTLKLKTRTEYRVGIEVEPYQYIDYVKIGGTLLEHAEKDTCSLFFVWSSGKMRRTDFRYRLVCPIVLKLDGLPEIKFNLQMKFYECGEVAHYTGPSLSSIDLKVKLEEKNERLRVMKILYN